MIPDDYCAAAIGGLGSDVYASMLFLPPAARRAGNAVHALAREISDVAHECQDPGVARTKFEWWREEIQRCYAGSPRHPVTQALAPVIAAHKIERELLLLLVNATEATLGRVRFDTFESLCSHCRGTGAVVTVLTARVFGITEPATQRYAEGLGIALRLTDILINLGRDVRRDRLYLPAESLAHFGVTEADVRACRHTPAFEALMAQEAERVRRCYDEAIAQLPINDRPQQLPGLIMAAIARAQLDEVKDDGYHVLERRVALTPLRKLWIAWTTRRAERRLARRAA